MFHVNYVVPRGRFSAENTVLFKPYTIFVWWLVPSNIGFAMYFIHYILFDFRSFELLRNSLEIRNKLFKFLSFIIFINTSYYYSKRLRLVKTGIPLNKNSVSGPRIHN